MCDFYADMYVISLISYTFNVFSEQKDQVFMLQPFTGKDFAIRSLADRIYDLQHLLYLYPNLNKDQVFSKYCTPVSGRCRIL